MTAPRPTDPVAIRLALRRISQRASAGEMGRALGVCASTVHRLERGHAITLETERQIERVLGLSRRELRAPISRAEIDAAMGQPGRIAQAAAHAVLTFFGVLEGAR